MDKKAYMTPEGKVIKLDVRDCILQGSNSRFGSLGKAGARGNFLDTSEDDSQDY